MMGRLSQRNPIGWGYDVLGVFVRINFVFSLMRRYVPEGIGRTRNFSEEEAEAKRVFKFLFSGAGQLDLTPPWAGYD